MDVHDCGDYRERLAERDGNGALPWRTLKAGMTLTIGRPVRARRRRRAARVLNIGIRIEDDAIASTAAS